MSRIGKAIITIPSGVEVKLDGTTVHVKGAKGQLTQEIDTCVTMSIDGNVISFDRESDHKDHRAKHGLMRSLVNNMIIGVSEGFKTRQELVGVGYRAAVAGRNLELSLGYSHNVVLKFQLRYLLQLSKKEVRILS